MFLLNLLLSKDPIHHGESNTNNLLNIIRDVLSSKTFKGDVKWGIKMES